MTYSHYFTLYCKGSQNDIDRFKEQVKKALDGMDNADDTCDTGHGPASISFSRLQAASTHEAWDDFLPVMDKFTGETPLSFFFALEKIDSDEDEAMCGYAVFDDGELVKEERTEWCTPQEFKTGKKKTDEGELYTKQNAHLEAEFKRFVQPALDQWLKAKPAKKAASSKKAEGSGDKEYQKWLKKVQTDKKALEKVPLQYKTPELCLAAVLGGGSFTLKFLPEELQTAELCLAAVQQHGEVLKYVPVALRTAPDIGSKLCLTAVQSYGSALKFVPEEKMTPELCLTAVQQNGKALEYVPEALRTAELCFAAVQQKGSALESVPEALRTPELCLAAVQKSGLALRYVPEALKTLRLCIAAVQQEQGWADDVLEYVPKAMKSKVKKATGIE